MWMLVYNKYLMVKSLWRKKARLNTRIFLFLSFKNVQLQLRNVQRYSGSGSSQWVSIDCQIFRNIVSPLLSCQQLEIGRCGTTYLHHVNWQMLQISFHCTQSLFVITLPKQCRFSQTKYLELQPLNYWNIVWNQCTMWDLLIKSNCSLLHMRK